MNIYKIQSVWIAPQTRSPDSEEKCVGSKLHPPPFYGANPNTNINININPDIRTANTTPHIEPIDGAAVDQGWKHAAPISEASADGAHAKDHV